MNFGIPDKYEKYAYDAYPSGIVVKSEDEILKEEYSNWYLKMEKKYGSKMDMWSLSELQRMCIEDYIVDMWAWEMK